MKTLFDWPVYRIGRWLYQQIDESIAYRCRRDNEHDWSEGYSSTPGEWKQYIIDEGVIDEDAV